MLHDLVCQHAHTVAVRVYGHTLCTDTPWSHPREYRSDLAAAKIAAQPPPELLDDDVGATLPRFPSLGAFFEEEDYSAWALGCMFCVVRVTWMRVACCVLWIDNGCF